VRLSLDLQPGTGSWDGLLWAYFYQGLPLKGLSLFGSTTFRYPTENSDGYRLGSELSYYLGTSHRYYQFLDLLAQIRGRLAGRDRHSGRKLSSTGGHWIYLVLGGNLNVTRSLSIQAYGQFPVYQNVNGIQLTPSYSLVVAGYFRITL